MYIELQSTFKHQLLILTVLNWAINDDSSLFYEISEKKGAGSITNLDID